MKKALTALSLILAVVITLSLVPLSAATYPSAFWKLNDKYAAALDAGDDRAIATYAEQICELFKGRWDEAAIGVMSSRYYEMANAYDRLGEYEKAAEAYRNCIPYFEKYPEIGLDGSENIYIAETKAMLYESTLDLYRTSYGYNTYYGAINEKRMGVLYGPTGDGKARSSLNVSESFVLIYQHFGEEMWALNKTMMKEAAKEGKAIEFALNLTGEGAEIKDVLNKMSYILDLVEYLEDLNTPVFLRFAAEMDVWTVQCTPADYITAFRYVADLVHNNSDNIAMVWSPTYARGWMMDVHKFYPGDEYVDWIGVSLYLHPYYQARDDWSSGQKIAMPCYFTGDAALPVKIMNELITVYGDRKPFIISESGAAHTYRQFNGVRTTKDTTEWAIHRLRMMYYYLPMAYPQIKAISHFDTVMPNETTDFSLSGNQRVKDAYIQFTKDSAFIQNSYNSEANATFEKLSDVFYAEQGFTEFRTLASYYGKDNVSVYYYIDGVQAAASATLPYTVSIDLSGYALGNHTVTVRAFEGASLLGEKSYTMVLSKAADIIINGEELKLTQKPVIVEGTTLVPLRAVVEKLGGTVEWIADTKTIVITSGGKKITLSIGSYDMVTNGKTTALAVPARLINSSTYIPLRAVSEAMNATVGWDGATKTITITK